MPAPPEEGAGVPTHVEDGGTRERGVPTHDDDGSIPTDFLREVARAPAAQPARDLTGATLGRYRILGRLGRGAMGVVYAAEDEVLRRPVALKVLPPHLVLDEARRRRFLREARSAAAAAHRSIAAVYDVVEHEDLVFIAMERVQGTTLRDAIAAAWGEGAGGERGRGLAAGEVARVGHRIACGLAAAHAAGVVHRDLKPDNVMLGPGDEVKILDFGVAKLREGGPAAAETTTLTEEGQLLGTPSYMAPEQAKGRDVDGRADVFSLGVLLYEMATGARPFTGATAAEVIIAIDRDAPEPPSRRNPAVPPELERILARCLEKRAADRYPCCAELAGDLLRLVPADAGDAGAPSRPADAAATASASPSWVGAPGAASTWVGTPRLRVPSSHGAAGSRARRRIAAWALAALAVALPLAGLGTLRGSGTAATPEAAAPLAAPGATLACPLLEAGGGGGAPAGWLGAAAASLACRRARALLGGAAERVLVPAALLDLPRLPGDAFPQDPFSAPDARQRTLDAARRRAAAYLDGDVVKERAGFRVALVLRDAAGRALGRGEGAGAALHLAVRGAMEPLVRQGVIPEAQAVDPEVAAWAGVRDVRLLVGLEDWELAVGAGVGAEDEEARLAPRQAEIGPRWARLLAMRASATGEGWERVRPPAIDRASGAAFARSAPVHAMLEPKVDPRPLADEARALAAAEQSPIGRAALAFAEAELRDREGDEPRARALLLAVLEQDASERVWDALSSLAYAQAGEGSGARAFAAWAPESAAAWNAMSISDEFEDSELPVRILGRAHALGPGTPLYAVHLSMALLARGRREEARAIAAELISDAAGPAPAAAGRLVAGEYVLAQVEASEARFGAALARARRVLGALPSFGNIASGDVYLLTLALELGALLGRAPEVAGEIASAFAGEGPPRVSPTRAVPPRIASACALAPQPAAGRCFARLRDLLARGFFREEPLPNDGPFLDGAEAYARGDWAAAAAAFRPLARAPGTLGRHLFPDTFDRAGDGELAASIDARQLARGPFHGAGLAHVRAARRALARGERESAEVFAKRIIDAWSVADAPVPAVDEMRALLTRAEAPRLPPSPRGR